MRAESSRIVRLSTSAVASSLDMSRRTLHRALAACGETFGAILIQARVDLAARMLQSPLLDRLTMAEIGRRAGQGSTQMHGADPAADAAG